ncbi:YaiI/YqxD family protein [Caldalkalibacillus mannanilyticus]|uniref:YaiI/YqxD family protein n=1 Tax=Caldalkalibacillus mannanilyticus TaxID=1418 RepID=UPI00046A02E1|nr:YaiI/YqxD family protein [Caldalkalibacillus mannanilyticus]
MKLIVDADACPVKDIIIEVGHSYQLPILMVCSYSHYSRPIAGVENIMVDNIAQAADMVIMNRVKAGDIVVTQDYGLASIVLAKGAMALHHTGKRYTTDNIDSLLFQRHVSAKVRRAGGKTKGPKPFTSEDKEKFRKVLIECCSQGRL